MIFSRAGAVIFWIGSRIPRGVYTQELSSVTDWRGWFQRGPSLTLFAQDDHPNRMVT